MELSMCRICLADDVRLQIIGNTHLQEVYECLTMLPFETKDNRPTQVCYICCAKLENCYQLKMECVHSEMLFTEALKTQNMALVESERTHKPRLSATEIMLFSMNPDEQDNIDDEVQMEPSKSHHIMTEAAEVEGSTVDGLPKLKGCVKTTHEEDGQLVEIIEKDQYDIIIFGNSTLEENLLESESCVQTSEKEDELLDEVVKEDDMIVFGNSPLEESLLESESCVQTSEIEDNLLHKDDVIVSEENPVREPDPLEEEAVDIQMTEVEDDSSLTIVKEELRYNETRFKQFSRTTQDTGGSTSSNLNKNENAAVEITEHNINTDNKTKSILYSLLKSTEGERSHEDAVTWAYGDIDGMSSETVVNLEPKLKKEWLPYSCLICHRSFSQIAHLKSHSRTHIGEKPFQCEICNKCFRVKSALNVHSLPYVLIKGAGFSGTSGLQRNPVDGSPANLKGNEQAEAVHVEQTDTYIRHSDKLYECNKCSKFFIEKAHLEYHIRRHLGERLFKCNICQKSFYSPSVLRNHLSTHNDFKPFECSICKKCFKMKPSLIKHTRTHTGERPFECDICKKRYNEKSTLKDHILTHTGEKPFQCKICKKRFCRKGSLKYHMIRHANELSYQCDICKKTFKYRNSLRKHLRMHTGKKPFKCNECHKRFAENSYLQRHLLTHICRKLNMNKK